MNRLINRIVNLLKWPVALLSLLLTLPLANELWSVLQFMQNNQQHYLNLFYGFAAFFPVWWLLLHRNHTFEWFCTFEHEITHVIFSILSLNRITSLNATSTQGGEMQYQGYGNWLITIAPYFFPTLPWLIIGLLLITQYQYAEYLFIALGFSLGFHVVASIKETHRYQTDLQKTGWVFNWAFLPSAHMLMLLLILLLLPGDRLNVSSSYQFVSNQAEKYTIQLYNQLQKITNKSI